MKTKILILVRRLDRGGAEMLEARLAAALASLGYDTYLGAQYSDDHFEGKQKAQDWKTKGVCEVFFLDSNRAGGVFKAMIRLIRWQHRFKFDVIISSNTGLATITSFVRWFYKFIHITAFHDYLTVTRLKSPRLWVWRYLLRKVDHAYSITGYVRDNMISFVPSLKKKITVVYNSLPDKLPVIEMETDIRRELGLSRESKLILYVGRLHYRKGLDLIIDYIGKQLDSLNANLLIMGEPIDARNLESGKMNYRATLLQKSEETGMASRIHFLGYRKDVFSIMKQADVLMHLARHEGFGLIFIEAFLARIPVVASNVGGIPEVMDQTTYPTFDLSAQKDILRETARLLQLTPEQRKQHTERAFHRVPFFTDKRRATDVDQLIKKLMANGKGI
jgi:glycosyltransferase involved in cell wall biosynthesis